MFNVQCTNMTTVLNKYCDNVEIKINVYGNE